MSEAIDEEGLTEEERRKQVEAALNEGKQLRKAKRHEEGIDLLVDALRYGVEKAHIYYQLGNIYYDVGDLDRAEYAYKRAITTDPDHVNAHHNLGVIYRQQGRIAESIKIQKRATRLEMKRPRRANWNPVQRKWLQRMAWRSLMIGAVLIGIVTLIVFQLTR
ncbi:MAG: tetratricopeptide repeat protein [Candidatus Bipolaricaulia bacterium]